MEPALFGMNLVLNQVPEHSVLLVFTGNLGIFPLEMGVATAGDQYTLQCNISLNEPITNSSLLKVMWLDPENDIISSGAGYTISGLSTTSHVTSNLTFTQLTTFQGGSYSCGINFAIPDAITDLQAVRTITVRVASAFNHVVIQ
jgi:hypothetical protein